MALTGTLKGPPQYKREEANKLLCPKGNTAFAEKEINTDNKVKGLAARPRSAPVAKWKLSILSKI